MKNTLDTPEMKKNPEKRLKTYLSEVKKAIEWRNCERYWLDKKERIYYYYHKEGNGHIMLFFF